MAMKHVNRALVRIIVAGFLVFTCARVWAATGGSISGTITDANGGVIPGATVTVRNLDTTITQTTTSNGEGFYAFTNLPVGRYELEIIDKGFKPYKRTGLVIDVNTQLRVDQQLTIGEQSQELVVSGTAVQVETESTQVGQVVTSTEITGVALNGRSFTDLLALQPGIVPMSTQQPNSIVMAGATVAIAPSGDLNPGNQSISGQREDANGYMINGGDVKELMNGGTTIVPDLDSIAEFRILTNNFDAEYGDYSGGIVNVVTKSGTNQMHGSGFEFLRNTLLDARNYFSPTRGFFRQNQFGGTAGGPIKNGKVFFFADYQGTRMAQAIDTGLISVPSSAYRMGDFVTGPNGTGPSPLTGAVGGANLANILTGKLGYPVASNEVYYTPGCTTSTCVFPGAMIPQVAWSAPAKYLLNSIPLPNDGPATFTTASQGEVLRDDKTSFRVDGNNHRWGLLSAYYFFDDFTLNNPYPTGQGGASVPGFNALNTGRSQLVNLADTKTFGVASVNEVHLSFMRSANVVGHPIGGVGPTLQSQGFVTCPGSVRTPGCAGIVPLAPAIEGIENTIFNSFVIGVPITNLAQANNTFTGSDNFSTVRGNHTLKAGFELSVEQINVNPNPTFNGSFLFSGTETGLDFADFLIGVSTNYNQADSQHYWGRHKYPAAFVQDTWRIKPSLTLNYGLRWELMQYWSEKQNQIPTFILGEQSKVYPTAPTSIVYPTDAGVPNTLVHERNRFAPRLGLAYSPTKSDGILGKMIGGAGKTSIRTGYGIFYSVIQGNTIAFDEPQPPYGLSYTGNDTLFATPFVTASDGSAHVNPFPLTFPSLNASVNHPNPNIDFSQFEPIAGMTAPPPTNTFPYSENYFLSIERQLPGATILSLNYVGSQAHHLLAVYSANPGNAALCLSLSQPNEVAPGSPTCGPNGEDTTYITPGGTTVNGTRGPLGSAFSNDDYEGSVANSNYNSFQASLRRSGKTLDLMLGYTYSKSIDQASSLADILDPFNFNATRGLSAFDLRHNFVATYEYRLPLERLTSRANLWTQGWAVSGITRASSGFPVTISTDLDNSLMGSLPNGVNNHSADLPDFAGGPLDLNGNPRNGLPYFNPSLFSPNALGTFGSSRRRFFYGPGLFNTDLALLKIFQFTESKALQFRLEAFNVFNHTQFFGPAAVNGDLSSALFGQVVNAAPPRLMQAALKFTF
jgi:Carboxypeptidase regulatory-like domain